MIVSNNISKQMFFNKSNKISRNKEFNQNQSEKIPSNIMASAESWQANTVPFLGRTKSRETPVDKQNLLLLKEYANCDDKTRKAEIEAELVEKNKDIVNHNISYNNVPASLMSREDMLQEGNIILLNSIRNYDLKKNVKFRSYAKTMVQNRTIDVARSLKPTGSPSKDRMKQYKEAVKSFEDKFFRKPTPKEFIEHWKETLIEELDNPKTTPSNKRVAKNILKRLQTEDKQGLYEYIDTFKTLSSLDMTSLDSTIASEGEGEIHILDVIPSNSLPAGDKAVINTTVEEILSKLKDNERRIFTLHYIDGLKKTEIAEQLDVSPQYVGKIYNTAKKKLSEEYKEYNK